MMPSANLRCYMRALGLVSVFAAVALFRAAWLAASPLALIAGLGLGATLIALSLIDIEVQRLPDVLTLPLLGAGLALAAVSGMAALLEHCAAAALGYGAFKAVALLYRARRGIDGLGGGDAKLLGAGAAWVGLSATPTIVLVASLAALTWIMIRAVGSWTLDTTQRIAFGPFLALGIWYAWLFGPLAFG